MRSPLLLTVAFLLGWIAAGGGGPGPVSAAAGPADFADAIASAEGSVVRVVARNGRTARTASRDDGVGGGFVVAADGWILTSRHVVGGAQRVIVTVPGHGAVDARIVAQDEATDTALLRVSLTGLPVLATGNPRRLRLGQWVVAGGSPYNLRNSWSVGIVSGLARANVGVGPRAVRDYIQTDAAANLGNSGGPLLDAGGRAVGVMTAILSRTGGHQGVALAIPIDLAMRAVDRMRANRGTVRRPSLGVRVRALPAVGGRPGGLYVSGFDPESSAASYGVRVGDVILAAGGRVMRRTVDLQRVVWAGRVGEILTIAVQRGTRRLSFKIPLR